MSGHLVVARLAGRGLAGLAVPVVVLVAGPVVARAAALVALLVVAPAPRRPQANWDFAVR